MLLDDPTDYTNLWTGDTAAGRVAHLTAGSFLWLAHTIK